MVGLIKVVGILIRLLMKLKLFGSKLFTVKNPKQTVKTKLKLYGKINGMLENDYKLIITTIGRLENY